MRLQIQEEALNEEFVQEDGTVIVNGDTEEVEGTSSSESTSSEEDSRNEQLYPRNRKLVIYDHYCSRTYNEIDFNGAINFDSIKICPRATVIVPPDDAKVIKGQIAALKYLAHLFEYEDEDKYLQDAKIKMYKSWRSKIFVYNDCMPINFINELKDYIKYKRFVVDHGNNVLSIHSPKIGKDKTYVKINNEYLYVPTVFLDGESVIPYRSYDVSLLNTSFLTNVLDRNNNNIRKKQKEIMRATLDLILKNDNLWLDLVADIDKITEKYKKDERIKLIKFDGDCRLHIHFKWRKVEDQVWCYKNVILPPMKLEFNIFTGDWYFIDSRNHPHTLSSSEICAWGFKQFISKALRELSLVGIVDAIVEFACSFTSTDCWSGTRDPRYIMQNYLDRINFEFDRSDWAPDVTYADVFLTLRSSGNLFWAAVNAPDLFTKTVGYIDFARWNMNSEYYLTDPSNFAWDNSFYDKSFPWSRLAEELPKIYPAIYGSGPTDVIVGEDWELYE